MHETSAQGLVHWEDPEGWDAEGGGAGVRMGNTCRSMADSCPMYGKNHYNIVISLQLIKINERKNKKRSLVVCSPRVGKFSIQ